MKNELGSILTKIGEFFKGQISVGARNYLEDSIANLSKRLGLKNTSTKYDHFKVVVPLKHAIKGMKVRIDGRTFVNYAQLESGVAVPKYVAKEAALPYKTYHPNDSMILNFGS